MGVHMPPSPMPYQASRKGGSLPSTAAPSGTASPVLRPWCNRNAASDMRNRRHAHRNGDAVHKHPDVDVHARHATDARRPGVKIRIRQGQSSPI